MHPENVERLRKHVLKYFNGSLRLYMSDLHALQAEPEALGKFYGPEAVRSSSAVADFVLALLGHVPPEMSSTSPTVREARKVVPDIAAQQFDVERARKNMQGPKRT